MSTGLSIQVDRHQGMESRIWRTPTSNFLSSNIMFYYLLGEDNSDVFLTWAFLWDDLKLFKFRFLAMAIAIPNWLSSHQVNHSVLGLQTSREHRKYSLKVCRVRKLPQFKNTFTLRIQGFQAPPPCRPKTVPLVYSEGDLCAIRPVTEVKVPEKVIEDAEVLPSSALAVADAIGTGFKVVRKSEDSKHLLSAASAEFLALCAEQLGLCEEIVGPNARFTVRGQNYSYLQGLIWPDEVIEDL